MGPIKLSKDISFPVDIVTQVEVIIAKRRAGKSYTMRRGVEQLLKNKQQVVLVDPKGDQWGLRSSADGKKPGYPVLILGGEHGDLPLEVNGGEVVARLVVEERVSVLLDLSQFRKHELATFMTAFLENLYRLKAQEKYRTPVKLVVDEADAVAPQKPQKGEERMLGAIEDIVRRGGQRGIGCTLVTQRSAVLNKNVLTQAQMLVVLRTIAPQDLAAMKAWIDVHGTAEQGKELMESLPSLPIGDAWFWSPGWPTDEGIFTRTHVLPIETFDSGATPKPGQKRVIPKNLADVDLDALKGQMAATIEKKKQDDPKMLRAEIARLTKELSVKPTEVKVKETFTEKIVEVPVVTAAQTKQLNAIFEKMYKEFDRHTIVLADIWGKLQPMSQHLSTAFALAVKNKEKAVPVLVPYSPQSVKKEFPVERGESATFDMGVESKSLTKGARSVLAYLESIYPAGRSRTQLHVATTYSPGSGFNNYIYELTGNGLIEKDAASGKYRALKKGDTEYYPSLNNWDSKLTLGARKVFRFLLGRSDTTTKQELSQVTGYTPGSGFNNYIYELTGNKLVVKEGTGYKINPEILDL